MSENTSIGTDVDADGAALFDCDDTSGLLGHIAEDGRLRWCSTPIDCDDSDDATVTLCGVYSTTPSSAMRPWLR